MKNDTIEFTEDNAPPPCCEEGKRGVIVNPGALGDSILILPLAEYMIKTLGLSSVDIIGKTDYVDFCPGRSCIRNVRAIDSIQFHRFFVDEKDFSIEEKDPLVSAFAGYDWIVSFLGEAETDFEKNLIFTIYSTQSAEISILPIFAPDGSDCHIADFYIKKFIHENDFEPVEYKFNHQGTLINPVNTDLQWGRQLLAWVGINPNAKTVIIQPGSGGRHKCWYLDNYCKIAADLKDNGYQVLFLLGPAEQERFTDSQKQKLSNAGKIIFSLNIKQVMQLLSAARGYIGNDSGVTHLAGAAGTKTVAVFGPTAPNVYKPIGPNVVAVTAESASFSEYCENSQILVKDAIYSLLND
ncbi:MAG: glycosyltransferase family 9 protein [Phycisphaerae bacterium]|nr:glycosyltransferase family 9 protein [Phycisphaerae bacterium]